MRSVTRRTRNPGDADQATTVENLISAFERMLARGVSFTTISIDQLAKEAGIARATFYLHFHNKGELVRHVMSRVEKELRSAAIESLVTQENFGRPEFLAFMRAVVAIQFRHRAAIRAMVEVSAYDPDVSQIYHAYMAHAISDTRRVIERLKATDRHHPAVTAEVADIVSWATERSCSQMLHDNDSASRRSELAESLTHVVWNAIAAPEPAPSAPIRRRRQQPVA